MRQVPYVYYAQISPPARWEDPVSYVQTTQTSVLAGEECTYYMDEVDKQWLDKNNRQARGENGQDKDPNIGVPISISKDEFELVMGLLEKFTDQQVKSNNSLLSDPIIAFSAHSFGLGSRRRRTRFHPLSVFLLSAFTG
jgi:hypothetical protein